jgi:hypothetical protein
MRVEAEGRSVETPEVHHPHPGHGGGVPRWLELIIAVTALITSVSSIAIAIHHGHIMNKLVEANSIPYLQAGFSDITPEGNDVLSLDLVNRGVGPAHEKSLRIKAAGRYVRSFDDLLSAVLGPAQGAEARKAMHPMWNRVRTRFVPGGQSQFVFRVARTPETASYWDALKKADDRWDIEICYCSVFDECWTVPSQWAEPQRVKQCVRDEPNEFLP